MELITHIYSIHLDKSNIFLELISINFASVLDGQTVAAKSLLFSENINSFKLSILFVRHRQIVQTQIRRYVLRRLMRVSTIC